MTQTTALVVFATALSLFSSCTTSSPPIPRSNEGTILIQVVKRGYHSGIVLPREALTEETLPESSDFADEQYLEFGWGDGEYYPAEEATVSLGVKALFFSSSTVLQIIGLTDFSSLDPTDTATISLTPAAFARLVSFISQTVARDHFPKATAVAQGNNPRNAFYPAKGSFSLYNNCNTWVANALNASLNKKYFTFILTSHALLHKAKALAKEQNRTYQNERALKE